MLEETVAGRLRSRRSGALQDISNKGAKLPKHKSSQKPYIIEAKDSFPREAAKRKLSSQDEYIQTTQSQSNDDLGNSSEVLNEDMEAEMQVRRSKRLSSKSSLSVSSTEAPFVSTQITQSTLTQNISPRIKLQDSRTIYNEDPSKCVDIIERMYANFRAVEVIFAIAPYMQNQKDITAKMRVILIDWIIDIHAKLKLHQSTLWLGINLIDRYLSRRLNLPRCDLQLLGISCLLIASKFEDIYPPTVDELVTLTDNTYTRESAIKMEADILRTLDWQLVVPTGYHFMMRYLDTIRASDHVRFLTFFYAERSLQEYDSLDQLPHIFVAACIYAALRHEQSSLEPTSLGVSVWSDALATETDQTEEALLPIARKIIQNAGELHKTSKRILYAAKKKYASDAFLRCSEWELPNL